jgi:hypothetical protein
MNVFGNWVLKRRGYFDCHKVGSNVRLEKKLRNMERNNLYTSPNNTAIESRWMKSAEHVAQMMI